MAQDKYKITISFTGYKPDGTFKPVEPMEFSVKTKKDLIKELEELKIESDNTTTRVLIEDSISKIEHYYQSGGRGGAGLPPFSIQRVKEDLNIK